MCFTDNRLLSIFKFKANVKTAHLNSGWRIQGKGATGQSALKRFSLEGSSQNYVYVFLHKRICDPLVRIWMMGTFPVVQWLRIRLPIQGNMGSSPGQGTKIPHAAGQLRPHAPEPARHNH